MDNDPNTSTNKKIIASFVTVLVIVVMIAAVSAANKRSTTSALASSDTSQSMASSATASNTPSATSSGTTTYKDGTYTASSSYETPGGQERITVQLTVANGAVTSTAVQQAANNRESAQYQARFKQSYSSYVVGKKLSDINLSRVSGSSLTTDGFNQALDQIITRATTA